MHANSLSRHYGSVSKEKNLYSWINTGTLHILASNSKTIANHKLCSKQKILIKLASLQWCSFETFRINIIEVRVLAFLCIKVGGWFCITSFDVLSTFYSNFVYISYTFKMPPIHWLYSEVGISLVFTTSNYIDTPWEKVVIPNVNTL